MRALPPFPTATTARAALRAATRAAACATILAAPAAAQIIVVPLEPAPGQAPDGDGTGQDGPVGDGLDGNGTGLVPTDPVTGFEPLPPDPGAGWTPIELDPIDPGAIEPWGEVSEDGTPVLELLPPGSVVGQDVTTVEEDAVTRGTGAVVKGLDKLAGTVEELRLASGETAGLGWLEISLGECRYPVDNPSGDAYAWLEIREEGQPDPVFRGWMIGSSPGLSALDHPRFDVWVLNCTLPETPPAPEPPETAASE